MTAAAIGLCWRCRHVQRVETQRGSVFLLCRLSATDARYPRYPRLPVLQCAGFAAAQDGNNSEKL